MKIPKLTRSTFFKLFSRSLLAGCSFTGAAEAKSWRVADFQDKIVVDKDGTAVVTERITLVFEGEWHGIHRTIPIEYPGPNGTNYELFLKVTSISDGAGGVLKYDSSTSNGSRDLKIYIPDAVDADAHGRDCLRGAQRHYPLLRQSRRVLLERDRERLAGTDLIMRRRRCAFLRRSGGITERASVYRRLWLEAGSDASAKVAGAEALFETNNPLPMRGGLTIDVYIPKDILKEPSALTKFFWFIGGNPVLFFPLVTAAGMFGLWWVKGRDPDAGMSVAPMYEPPAGISPAEAGTLLDDSIHPRDITSTIVDLAVRGYIKIEETAEKGLVFTHKDYVFHLLKPMAEWNDVGLSARTLRVMLESTCFKVAQRRGFRV